MCAPISRTTTGSASAVPIQKRRVKSISSGFGPSSSEGSSGYAILDDPAIPIIGEGDKEPNDTYIEQLMSGAQAAVDELVRRGVGDRDRQSP